MSFLGRLAARRGKSGRFVPSKSGCLVSRRADAGFTLVELLVVVMILGILAFLGVPQYLKTVESSKADDAQTTTNMIAQANRMYNLDNEPNWGSGELTGPAHALIAAKYIANQSWATKPWKYFACDPTTTCGVCSGTTGLVACTMRRTGAPPGTDTSPYNGWGYTVDQNGVMKAVGSAPPPSS